MIIADKWTREVMKDLQGSMSATCILGVGHFLKCSKLDCTCICHELDGEGLDRITQRSENGKKRENETKKALASSNSNCLHDGSSANTTLSNANVECID